MAAKRTQIFVWSGKSPVGYLANIKINALPAIPQGTMLHRFKDGKPMIVGKDPIDPEIDRHDCMFNRLNCGYLIKPGENVPPWAR